MTNNTAPNFTFDQGVNIDGFTCGCYTSHHSDGCFRRYIDGDYAEVFTCYGSRLVSLDSLAPA